MMFGFDKKVWCGYYVMIILAFLTLFSKISHVFINIGGGNWQSGGSSIYQIELPLGLIGEGELVDAGIGESVFAGNVGEVAVDGKITTAGDDLVPFAVGDDVSGIDTTFFHNGLGLNKVAPFRADIDPLFMCGHLRASSNG